jgi:hypothetical protein
MRGKVALRYAMQHYPHQRGGLVRTFHGIDEQVIAGYRQVVVAAVLTRCGMHCAVNLDHITDELRPGRESERLIAAAVM